jgi:competence protein ComEC
MRCRSWEFSLREPAAPNGFPAMLEKLKTDLLAVIERRLSSQSSAVMKAMLLGEKSGVSPLILKAMVNSGTIHILVVSGFNVGIVAFMLSLLLKLLRVPPTARILLLLPFIFAYCLLTGGSEPVVRAGIMSGVMVIACLGGRDGDILNALALAAWAMLLWNPRLIFDASFQLSFASVCSLVLLYPAAVRRLRLEKIGNSVVRWLCEGLTLSACAWLGTAGFVAYYFRILSPGAIPVNLLAAPMAGFITLCGFAMLLAERILPVCARYISLTADYSICLLVHIVSLPIPFFSFK